MFIFVPTNKKFEFYLWPQIALFAAHLRSEKWAEKWAENGQKWPICGYKKNLDSICGHK